MGTNFSGQQEASNRQDRFSRHPITTVSILLLASLLFVLLAAELFLRTFSGLGNPPLYDLSPLYGYRLKPNQMIHPRGGMGFLYGARITTNNLGLRAAEDWDSNPAGKILFLGDSVAYGGQYVSDSDIFISVAGNMLPGWQVGNGAINAWGIGNMVGLIKDYEFTPAEVVVTCVIEGDFYRGTTRAPSMPLWTERPQFALQDLAMHFIWSINMLRYKNNDAQGPNQDTHINRIVNHSASQLKQLGAYLNDRQVKHFIFILPTRSQVVHGEPPDPLVNEAISQNQIQVEYLLPKLIALEPDPEKREKWYQDEVHLEAPGHRTYGLLIGYALAQALSGDNAKSITQLKEYPLSKSM